MHVIFAQLKTLWLLLDTIASDKGPMFTFQLSFRSLCVMFTYIPGTDLGFQVRGGPLKKIAPRGGRREHFWGISCEKSRFYANCFYFFPILGGVPPPGSAPTSYPFEVYIYLNIIKYAIINIIVIKLKSEIFPIHFLSVNTYP